MNFNEQELKEINQDVQKFVAMKSPRLIGRPNRTIPIGSDDLVNLKIALNVAKSINSFIEMV